MPEDDSLVSEPSAPPAVSVSESAGFRSLTVAITYRLPAGLSSDRRSRGEEPCDERIVSRVSLTDGVPRIDVSTVVENVADDHRLRVHFPKCLGH